MANSSSNFIKKVFDTLETHHISYGILRKSAEIMCGEAHDIDMCVDFNRIDEVIKQLDICAKEECWNRFLCCDKDNGSLKTIHFYYIKDEKIDIVHFDLFRDFSWNGIILFDNSMLVSNLRKENGVFCVEKKIEEAIKFFSRYLYHGYIKEEYKESIYEYATSNRTEFLNVFSTVTGGEVATELCDLASNQNWTEIEDKVEKVRMEVKIVQKATNPLDSRITKIQRLAFQLNRLIHPQGLMVSFLGTDGSGKSTIIDALPKVLGNTFDETQIKYYHWRPKFIKSPKGNKNADTDVSDPHKKKPYGKVISYGKFMYFNLDYILGYFFSVRKHIGKNELVVFDRYYYDYLLDKYRYRLDISDRVIKAFRHIIPSPHITFLLIGDAEVLFERKKELPIEEMEKQINRLKSMEKIIPNSFVVDVNEDIDTVVFNCSRKILKEMKRRNEAR